MGEASLGNATQQASWMWNHGLGIMAVVSWLWNLSCCMLAVESCLWNSVSKDMGRDRLCCNVRTEASMQQPCRTA